MNQSPVVIEQILNAPIAKVWLAISEEDQIKKWSFVIPAFKPEVGIAFSFDGGPDNRIYHHQCRVLEVIAGKKLAYSWRFEGYEGNSTVTTELFEEGNKTRIKLTHAGLETFPQENPDFARPNFVEGWTQLIGASLRKLVE